MGLYSSSKCCALCFNFSPCACLIPGLLCGSLLHRNFGRLSALYYRFFCLLVCHLIALNSLVAWYPFDLDLYTDVFLPSGCDAVVEGVEDVVAWIGFSQCCGCNRGLVVKINVGRPCHGCCRFLSSFWGT